MISITTRIAWGSSTTDYRGFSALEIDESCSSPGFAEFLSRWRRTRKTQSSRKPREHARLGFSMAETLMVLRRREKPQDSHGRILDSGIP